METLWRSEELSTEDFGLFKYGNDLITGVTDTRPEWTAFHTSNTLLVSPATVLRTSLIIFRASKSSRDGSQKLEIAGRGQRAN